MRRRWPGSAAWRSRTPGIASGCKTTVAELTAAQASVRVLAGLLPICASCKKIRDDAGFWHSVEKYMQDHTDATFTHGICPDCTEKLFPGFGRR